MAPFFSKFRHISPAMMILSPVKQHIGCCLVLPVLLKLLGGVAFVQVLTRNVHAEFLILAAFLPILTYLVLKGEDFWRSRHAHHDHVEIGFLPRYLVNLSLAFVLAYAMHRLFHAHG